MRKIAFIRSTSVRYEPVIKRKALAAFSSGIAPHVLYWDRQGCDRDPYEEEVVSYIPIWVGKTSYGRGIYNIVKRCFFSCKIIGKLKDIGPEVINACDLDTMIPVLVYKFLFHRKTKIVYDVLDFIQTFSSPVPNFVRKILNRLDKLSMKIADTIIIPDENRYLFIPEEFKRKTKVIYNAPDITFCYLPDQRTSNIKKIIMILYIGGLSVDRGIEILLDVVKELPGLVTLTIGGNGILSEMVADYAQKFENINYLGTVNYDMVLQFTSEADVLYAVYNPEFIINRYASPNKFFEAVAYGKPIIVARGTSIDEKVMRYDIGYVIDYSKDALKDVIESIRNNGFNQKRANAAMAYDNHNWVKMKSELAQIYSEL